jgi:membrane protein implicated in regulation of membrane protease activity
MQWESFKQRVSDSAVEFALSAFWVAVWGALVSVVIGLYLFAKGASPYLLVALASTAMTFLLVLITTAAIVFLQRRGKHGSSPARVGRKGFLDYKIQGQRALTAMTGSLNAITRLMKAVGKDALSGAKRTARAQKGRGNTDERAYRVMNRTAHRLDKRASAMKLHSANYALNVAAFVEGFGKWSDWVIESGSTSTEQRRQVADLLDSFGKTAAAQIPSLEQFCASVEQGRAAGEHMDLAGQSLIPLCQ